MRNLFKKNGSKKRTTFFITPPHQKSFFFLLLFILFSSNCIFAQKKSITGNITDDKGQPVAGASVVVKGKVTGTTTSETGEFSIDVLPTAVLVISAVGYAPKEIKAGDESTINVQLSKTTESMAEVVVVAYGTQSRPDITGSVVSIKASELKDQPVTQFAQSIQGKTPGVQINQTTGTPGSGISFRIRGAASFSATSQPLFVVDGVPLVSDINNINYNTSIIIPQIFTIL